jgi:cell division protease FtsH
MFTKPYSDETAKIIDEEVSGLIEAQYSRALKILKKNKTKLIELAEKLLTDEVIFKEDLEARFGVREWETVEESETKPIVKAQVDDSIEASATINQDEKNLVVENKEEQATEEESAPNPDPSEE